MVERDGWWTRIHPSGDMAPVFDAATHYQQCNIPLIVLAGRDFGSGSSRDWAAKGPALLGVRAVIARSYERIHRSNLIGVGIVPLRFAGEEHAGALALNGSEEFDFAGLAPGIAGRSPIAVTARRGNGAEVSFSVRADVRSEAEADLLRRGGMFQSALDRVMMRPTV
jgi:aconitate hydratase